KFETQKFRIATAHGGQAGAAIDLLTPVVAHELLGAYIADQHPRNFRLPDAERHHLLQVLFKNQTPHANLRFINSCQDLRQLFLVFNAELPTASVGSYTFEAQRTPLQQVLRSVVGIFDGKCREAMQYSTGGGGTEFLTPSGGHLTVIVEQWMGNGFG